MSTFTIKSEEIFEYYKQEKLTISVAFMNKLMTFLAVVLLPMAIYLSIFLPNLFQGSALQLFDVGFCNNYQEIFKE